MNSKCIKLFLFIIITALSSEISCYSVPPAKKEKSKNQKEKSLNILKIGDSNGALPFGPDELVGEKYTGGMDRVSHLNTQLEIIAKEESVIFINTCHIPEPVFKQLTSDGVHLNAAGQKMIALIIQENLKY